MSTPTVEKKDEKVPELKDREFIGYFRFGNRPPMTKVFIIKGHLPAAIGRFRLHCDRMNYKFISVHPHLVDLDEQEKLKLDRNEDEFVGDYFN